MSSLQQQQKQMTTAEDLMRLLERHLELKRQLRCVFIEMNSMVPVLVDASNNFKSPSTRRKHASQTFVQSHGVSSSSPSWTSLDRTVNHPHVMPVTVVQKRPTSKSTISSVPSLINSIGFDGTNQIVADDDMMTDDSNARNQATSPMFNKSTSKFVEVSVDQLLEESMQSLDETPQKRQSGGGDNVGDDFQTSAISLASVVKTIKNELDFVEKSLKKSHARLERMDDNVCREQELKQQHVQEEQKKEISIVPSKPTGRIDSFDFDCDNVGIDVKNKISALSTMNTTTEDLPIRRKTSKDVLSFDIDKNDPQLAEINLASEKLIQNMTSAISSIENKLHNVADESKHFAIQESMMVIHESDDSLIDRSIADRNQDISMMEEMVTSSFVHLTKTEESQPTSLDKVLKEKEATTSLLVKKDAQTTSEQNIDMLIDAKKDSQDDDGDDEQSTLLIEQDDSKNVGIEATVEVGFDSIATIINDNQVMIDNLSNHVVNLVGDGGTTILVDSIAVEDNQVDTTIESKLEIMAICSSTVEEKNELYIVEHDEQENLSTLNDSQQEQEVFENFSPSNKCFGFVDSCSSSVYEPEEIFDKDDIHEQKEDTKEEKLQVVSIKVLENDDMFDVADEDIQKMVVEQTEVVKEKVMHVPSAQREKMTIKDEMVNVVGEKLVMDGLLTNFQHEGEVDEKMDEPMEKNVNVDLKENEDLVVEKSNETVCDGNQTLIVHSDGIIGDANHGECTVDNQSKLVIMIEQSAYSKEAVLNESSHTSLLEVSIKSESPRNEDSIEMHIAAKDSAKETCSDINHQEDQVASFNSENTLASTKVEEENQYEEVEAIIPKTNRPEVDEIRPIEQTEAMATCDESSLNLLEECCIKKDNKTIFMDSLIINQVPDIKVAADDDDTENQSDYTKSLNQLTWITAPNSSVIKNVATSGAVKTFATKDNNNSMKDSAIIPTEDEEVNDDVENVSQWNTLQIVSKDDSALCSLDSIKEVVLNNSSNASSNSASFESGFMNKDKDWKKKFKQSLCVMPVFEPANANRKLALFEQASPQPKEDYHIARTTVQPLPAFGTATNPSAQQEAVVTELAAALKGRLRSMKLSVNTDEA